jgi:hypothetical protein
VARHIFHACPVWIYTQSNITSILGHVNFILLKFSKPAFFGPVFTCNFRCDFWRDSLLLMDAWIRHEYSDEDTYTQQNIHNSFIRSHPSKYNIPLKNSAQIASVNRPLIKPVFH